MDLGQLGSVGGFFALRAGAPPAGAVPLARAYAADGASALAHRVDKVVARLRAPEVRIGVSVAQLGLAARLCSVAVGGAALFGAVPDLDPERLHWDPDGTSPDDLWIDRVEPLPVGRIAEVLVEGHLAPLAAALTRRYRIAPGLLRGNAGSALAGSVRELETWAAEAGRPEAAARGRAAAEELFADPGLQAAGPLPEPGARHRRRSCCLYYRCPGGGLCGDCCFETAPRTAD
ncbi:ferric iron reductase [Streptomyces triticagri]|uniref:Ferric iron reductase n=1 Tax=Streptomyces triticagri TaxID=2293568 RepID=A0A372LY92_9ACTN|nr:(2Fe-2S)-binding protein [Streptomyces triticagri]RFU83233.1 ferric iron reductase [Streptomyces triticagri]